MTSLRTIRHVLSPLMRVYCYLTQRSDGTLNRRLAELLDPAVPASKKPVDGVATFDAVIDSSTGVWVRFFVPTQAYLPHDAIRDHPVANVTLTLAQDVAKVDMPPVLVIIGGLDILQDWDRRYAEGMKKAGKQVQVCFYEDAVHWFAQLNQAVVAEQMLIDVATLLRSHQE